MKTQYLMTAALGVLLAVFGQVNAGEDDLSKDQVPKAVIAAFEKAYPNAKGAKFEEETFEGKAAYEVEYKENDKEYDLLYSADGTLLQKQEEIGLKSLPEPVAQAIKKDYPQAEIKEVEKMMKPDSTVTGYEVEIETDDKKIELELDVSGKILKTEND
ncbi:PepSY-like domain-containing protein [Methylobacter sp.]|jgi:uncharacterized membrane protein YkoI|uniref:PepSY-like domain-containing protein n=1 Tax=Methylobacter sp. TaxID=2051955 RepID=UPI003DA5FB55